MIDVAVVGCGEVAHRYHAPALSVLEGTGALRVTAVLDPSRRAAQRFVDRFRAARAVADLPALLATRPAVVIVASPPRFHAEQVVAALEAGCDVLCEKPLATSAPDGRRMVDAAERTGRRLAVGMVRRQLPATRALRRILRAGVLGDIRSVECFEGGPFTWPVASPDYFRPDGGNGGVLQDVGTHCLDLLTWWFGEPTSTRYADDAMGGVEANCELALTFGATEAHVRLSRDWARPNRYVVEGTRGRAEWEVDEARVLRLDLDDGPLGDLAVDGPDRDGSTAVTTDFEGAFVAQLRAVATGRWEQLTSGREALPVLEVVDRCYACRDTMPMPWLRPGGGR